MSRGFRTKNQSNTTAAAFGGNTLATSRKKRVHLEQHFLNAVLLRVTQPSLGTKTPFRLFGRGSVPQLWEQKKNEALSAFSNVFLNVHFSLRLGEKAFGAFSDPLSLCFLV